MPLDLAQFLRNSVAVDRYDAIRNDVGASEKAGKAEQAGTLMGTAFVVESNPLAELMDAMEELTFMFEEQETKEVAERKLGEEHENPFIRALSGWKTILPDLPSDQFAQKLLALLRQAQSRGQLPTVDSLLRQLSEGSQEPVHQFAILSALSEAFGGSDDSEFQTLLRATREALESAHGDEIRAGINLAKEVNARATTPEEMQGLRDLSSVSARSWRSVAPPDSRPPSIFSQRVAEPTSKAQRHPRVLKNFGGSSWIFSACRSSRPFSTAWNSSACGWNDSLPNNACALASR